MGRWERAFCGSSEWHKMALFGNFLARTQTLLDTDPMRSTSRFEPLDDARLAAHGLGIIGWWYLGGALAPRDGVRIGRCDRLFRMSPAVFCMARSARESTPWWPNGDPSKPAAGKEQNRTSEPDRRVELGNGPPTSSAALQGISRALPRQVKLSNLGAIEQGVTHWLSGGRKLCTETNLNAEMCAER